MKKTSSSILPDSEQIREPKDHIHSKAKRMKAKTPTNKNVKAYLHQLQLTEKVGCGDPSLKEIERG